MESEDYAFYQGLVFLLEHNVKDLGYDLNFSTEVCKFSLVLLNSDISALAKGVESDQQASNDNLVHWNFIVEK